jgi:hypothetical protein
MPPQIAPSLTASHLHALKLQENALRNPLGTPSSFAGNCCFDLFDPVFNTVQIVDGNENETTPSMVGAIDMADAVQHTYQASY